MTTRDLGVSGDYVDRAFRGYETRTQDLKTAYTKRASQEAAKRGMEERLAAQDARRRAAEALDALMAARPLKPPGRR